MIEWHIQSRSHHCQRCNASFRDKEPFHTLLSEHRFGYARLDVCEHCWKTTPVDQETPSISRWQSVYVPPPLAPPDPIQKENAESLLRRLVELHNPAHLASCYILAVMLERKRILKVKEQIQREGQRIFLYEHPKTGDLFTIVDPALQLNQLEQVQREVAFLLEHGIAPDSQPLVGASESHPAAVVPATPSEGGILPPNEAPQLPAEGFAPVELGALAGSQESLGLATTAA